MMSKGPRRRFTREFKEQAVARLSMPGATQAGVAHELGITSSQLKSWRLELASSTNRFPLASIPGRLSSTACRASPSSLRTSARLADGAPIPCKAVVAASIGTRPRSRSPSASPLS